MLENVSPPHRFTLTCAVQKLLPKTRSAPWKARAREREREVEWNREEEKNIYI